MNKYKFTEKTKTLMDGTVLRQIKAVRSFSDVKEGESGGWIEKESNLSQDGDAWVYEGAQVYGDAQVHGNAQIYGNAQVYENARVHGNAHVHGDAMIYEDARVFVNAHVYGNAQIYGNAQVCRNAQIYGNAQVCGDARVYGNAQVCGDAQITETSQYIVIGPAGSRGDFTTFFKTIDSIYVKCGCFAGSIQAFLEKVKETHGDGRFARVYQAAAMLAKEQIRD